MYLLTSYSTVRLLEDYGILLLLEQICLFEVRIEEG